MIKNRLILRTFLTFAIVLALGAYSSSASAQVRSLIGNLIKAINEGQAGPNFGGGDTTSVIENLLRQLNQSRNISGAYRMPGFEKNGACRYSDQKAIRNQIPMSDQVRAYRVGQAHCRNQFPGGRGLAVSMWECYHNRNHKMSSSGKMFGWWQPIEYQIYGNFHREQQREHFKFMFWCEK